MSYTACLLFPYAFCQFSRFLRWAISYWSQDHWKDFTKKLYHFVLYYIWSPAHLMYIVLSDWIFANTLVCSSNKNSKHERFCCWNWCKWCSDYVFVVKSLSIFLSHLVVHINVSMHAQWLSRSFSEFKAMHAFNIYLQLIFLLWLSYTRCYLRAQSESVSGKQLVQEAYSNQQNCPSRRFTATSYPICLSLVARNTSFSCGDCLHYSIYNMMLARTVLFL